MSGGSIRLGRCEMTIFAPTLVQLVDDPVSVNRLARDQAVEFSPLDPGRDADGVVALAGQQDKADEIAQRVGERVMNEGREVLVDKLRCITRRERVATPPSAGN